MFEIYDKRLKEIELRVTEEIKVLDNLIAQVKKSNEEIRQTIKEIQNLKN